MQREYPIPARQTGLSRQRTAATAIAHAGDTAMHSAPLRLLALFLPVAIIMAALATLAMHGVARAQEPVSLAPLPAYLKTAAENNGELQAAFARWRAAVQKAPQASVMPDPELRFGYFIEPVETRTGPQRWRYGISQKFPWPGKLSDKEQIALHEADTLRAQAEGTKLALYRDVKNAFYEYAYLERAINITRENEELLQYLEDVARARYAAGGTPYSDVLRTQVELDKLGERLRSMQDLRTPLGARLNAAMGRETNEPVQVPDAVPVMEISMNDDTLRTALKENNPALHGYDAQAEKAKSAASLAERNYFPDVTLGLESIYTDRPRNNADMFNKGDDPLIASIGINLPIWRSGRDAAVIESKEMLLAAHRGRQGKQDSLLADLELALFRYRDAGRRIELYKDTLLPRAEQAIEVSLQAYQSGKASFSDITETQKSYLELHLAYARALTDQAQRIADMEALTGGEIPCKYHGSVLEKPSLPESDLKTTIK